MGFSVDWLDLREPADHAARDRGLMAAAAACVGPGQVVLDLGSGTGSTARAFNGELKGARWRFLDADAALLSETVARHPGAERVEMDLRDIAALPLDGVGLVTASALLDLVSADWIAALAERLRDASVPLYAALNYDGQMAWTPEAPEDADVTAAFNAHQRGDKGFGPSEGPAAAQTAARVFRERGFDVKTAPSPWQIAGDQAPLHAMLLDGIAGAASEMGEANATAWLTARKATLATSAVTIGHTDLLALPPVPPNSER